MRPASIAPNSPIGSAPVRGSSPLRGIELQLQLQFHVRALIVRGSQGIHVRALIVRSLAYMCRLYETTRALRTPAAGWRAPRRQVCRVCVGTAVTPALLVLLFVWHVCECEVSGTGLHACTFSLT